MPRKRKHNPLGVFLNTRRIGRLHKEYSGAIRFTYDSDWLQWDQALPVSLSLPLREDSYTGNAVLAVFENLLPDNEHIRNRVASKFQAEGIDPYSLLAAIGRDCVGALQFLENDDTPDSTHPVNGVELNDQEIAHMLTSLSKNPLGLNSDDDFRISIAGAQEKTALHKDGDKWLLPKGTTPTTHIFKTQIGQLSNGLDLTQSVENEFLCLNIVRRYGLPVADATIESFDGETALVVERFDRKKLDTNQLIRLPQEDCCQALSYLSTQKYQRDGGPGIEDIMLLLLGSDDPSLDRITFFKAQVLFWLLGATDGHAKNFSVTLYPQGRFRMTPLYDILTLQPSVDRGQVLHKEFKMAMRVGSSKKYHVQYIRGRHFSHTGRECGLSTQAINTVFDELMDTTPTVLNNITDYLPDNFPAELVDSITAGVLHRLPRLSASD